MEGESTRQLKVAREIQKDMAEIIRGRGMAAYDGALVTVSGVRVSPDLSVAKVYVSIFPSSKAEAVMKSLSDNVRTEKGGAGKGALLRPRKSGSGYLAAFSFRPASTFSG